MNRVLIALAVHEAMAIALIGIALRNRHRLCRSFTFYLAAVLGFESLAVAWPERFFTYSVWTFQETLFAVLKLALALELVYLTFARLPGALTAAKVVVLAGILVMLYSVAPFTFNYEHVAARMQPRLATGTAWLFTLYTALVYFFRVPLHPYHRTILIGLVPYLVVSGLLNNLLDVKGWSVLPAVDHLDPLAYLLASAYWARGAWRRDEAPVESPAVLETLQPWRVR
jgi:hypothetical protein